MILGAGGMLGHKLCQTLRSGDVVGVVRKSPAAYERFTEAYDGVRLMGGVDVLEPGRMEDVVRQIRPSFVINCIGVVKQLDEADDPYLAVAINSLLPHRLAGLCAEIGARLVHISTDCVFDGARGSYRETDHPSARDLYGRSKSLGETTAAEASAITLRTSFIGREIGSPAHGLLEWFLAQEGGRVNGLDGVIYTGLTSLELTRVIRLLIDGHADLHGTFHVASEAISKHDLLLLIRRVYGLDIEIRRVDKPSFDRSLLMGPFSRETGYTAPSWAEMIQELHEDPTPYDKWQALVEGAK